MTIWEKLFGTPERTAEAIDGSDQIDLCCWMESVTNSIPPKRCEQCLFECDRYGCYDKGMTLLDWLKQEVDE